MTGPRTRPAPPTASSARSLRRAYATLTVLSVAAFIFVTSEILPFGLITLIANDLGRTKSQVGLLVTAYALVIVAASVPLAHFTRHVPRRTVLAATLVTYSLGMILAVTLPGFGGLLAGRMLTALAQAQFWAVVTATAAGLFPPEVRGKAVSRLLIGPSAGGVLGLPTGTWLGLHFGWRVPFVVLACVGLVMAVAIVLLVPHYKPSDGSAARGSAPNKRRFVVVLAVTATAVLGGAVIYTYITPFLEEITGFASSVVFLVLFASGVAGMVSMVLVGRFLDRFPMGTLATGLGMVLVGWVGVGAFGTNKALVFAFFVFVGLGLSVMVGGFANRVMQVSPGSTDMGIAAYAALYNAGTALGSLLGAGLLAWWGPRWLPMVAAGFVAIALGLVAAERKITAPVRESQAR